MKNIINGAIYEVIFRGVDASEFTGSHPAIVIRTIKEEKIFFVVPLTTYTRERWERAKRSGFGKRILSTNSIARIDKMKIIHFNELRGRWVDRSTNSFIRMTIDELDAVNKKVDEYLILSERKALTEYGKYIENYENINEVIEGYSNENTLSFSLDRADLKDISLGDIDNICKKCYPGKTCAITYNSSISRYAIVLT